MSCKDGKCACGYDPNPVMTEDLLRRRYNVWRRDLANAQSKLKFANISLPDGTCPADGDTKPSTLRNTISELKTAMEQVQVKINEEQLQGKVKPSLTLTMASRYTELVLKQAEYYLPLLEKFFPEI